jgi:integrase
MKRMLVDLFHGRYQLCHLDNFGARHAVAILQRWTDLGHASSTMATYVSHLRIFVVWLGKRELLPIIDRYCADHPGLTQRRTATDRDKSERGVGVDYAEIFRRAVATGDQYFVHQLLLIVAFGLRVREAWQFRPHLATGEFGRVEVKFGTKGGRSRTLPTPMSPVQHAVLERAQALVSSRYGSMIPPGYERTEQWARHFYHLCRRIGLTNNQLGITPHSLRHGVLLDLFEVIAGVPAPVRGGSEVPLDAAREQAAREIVAEFAGHSRLQVSSAYLGSRGRRRAVKRSAPKRTPESGGGGGPV